MPLRLIGAENPGIPPGPEAITEILKQTLPGFIRQILANKGKNAYDYFSLGHNIVSYNPNYNSEVDGAEEELVTQFQLGSADKKLKEVLISADVGYTMASKIVSEVNLEAKKKKIIKSEEINEIILDKMFVIYTDGEVISTRLNFNEKGLTCFLIVGVNGSDVAIVEPTKPQQDPASVVFQGVDQALKNNYDVVLIDTAGRLENKVNLMQELNKINKIIKQKLEHESDEILLVLDATTGQNGIIQAQEFAKIVPVSGIVLTKMDGTAKGGIILAVKEYLGLPVKLIGLGEQATDLEEFDLDQYLYNLTSDLFIGAKNE
ncbi:signal recognition particle receptor [Lasius niger]|uniref:Signal recognition particle receptor n=1 Tax=Lasius niger TaxID=67767 RepID=A0A0J7L2R2_LASNI|nr:signal recognition particle receptor [Lasius niger]